jgi:putative ABC transport system permease protein
MHKWLQDFVYRIQIDWWVFAAASIVALIVAIVTISSQAIKAAIANPIKSLRTE